PPRPLLPTIFPYTTLFRSHSVDRKEGLVAVLKGAARDLRQRERLHDRLVVGRVVDVPHAEPFGRRIPGRVRASRCAEVGRPGHADRKSTRLNSSHVSISYA